MISRILFLFLYKRKSGACEEINQIENVKSKGELSLLGDVDTKASLETCLNASAQLYCFYSPCIETYIHVAKRRKG